MTATVDTTVESWAARIRPHLARTVEGIIAAGRELIEAKAALPHGQFGVLLAELGIGERMAQRFMRVARHPVLANPSRVTALPAAIGVLDEMARIPEEELLDALNRGEIGPATTRAELLAFTRSGADRPTEHEIAEMVVEAIVARYQAARTKRDKQAWSVPLHLVDEIMLWADSGIPNAYTFGAIAQPMWCLCDRLDVWNLMAILLVPVAKLVRQECDLVRTQRNAPDWRAPTEPLAEVTIAVWEPDIGPDMRQRLCEAMEDQIAAAIIDANTWCPIPEVRS